MAADKTSTISHHTSSQISTKDREIVTGAALCMPPHALAWGHPWEGISLVPLGWCDYGKLLGGTWGLSWAKGEKERKEKITGEEKAGPKKQQESENANKSAEDECSRAGGPRATAQARVSRGVGTEHGDGTGCVLGRGSDTVPHPTIRWADCHG